MARLPADDRAIGYSYQTRLGWSVLLARLFARRAFDPLTSGSPFFGNNWLGICIGRSFRAFKGLTLVVSLVLQEVLYVIPGCSSQERLCSPLLNLEHSWDFERTTPLRGTMYTVVTCLITVILRVGGAHFGPYGFSDRSDRFSSPSEELPVSLIPGTFYEYAKLFFLYFSSSGGWGKIKLKLTTLPRIFIRVVCRFNSVASATQR